MDRGAPGKISRPFAVLGAAVWLAAVAAPLLDSRVAVILAMAGGGLVFCIFVVRIGRKWRGKAVSGLALFAAVALLCVSLFFALFAWRWKGSAAPAQKYSGAVLPARMEILDYPDQRYGRCYYRAEVQEIDGQPLEKPFTIRLSCQEPIYCQPCDQVLCEVGFYSFREDGPFSTFASQLAGGNVLGAWLNGYDAQVIPNEEALPAGRMLPALRQILARNLDRCLPGDVAGLLQTVLLGSSVNLPASAYADFRQLGCSHMLAISGLHMSLVAAFISLALSRLPGPKFIRNLGCAFILFVYLLITGCPASAVRSYVMYFLFLLANSIGSKPDGLNSLGVAVLVICLHNPFSGGDVGFSLSVLSTAGIIMFYRPLSRAMTKPLRSKPVLALALRPVISSLAVTVSAMTATLPIQVLLFGGLPLISPLANLVLLPLFTALLYCALPLLILTLYPAGMVLAQPVVLVCGILAKAILWAAHRLAAIPGIFLSLSQPGWAFFLILFAFGLSLLLAKERPPKRRVVVAGLLMVLGICAPGAWGLYTRDDVTVAVYGGSRSFCVVVMEKGRASVLSLGGADSTKARQILSTRNIRSLESVLISSQDYRAKAMARELLASVTPQHLYLPEGSYVGKDIARFQPEEVPVNGVWQALPDLPVTISGDGTRLSFTANGTDVIVDLGDESPGSCDLLITRDAPPDVRTELTLLVCDEGTLPEDAAGQVYSSVILGESQAVTYITLSPGGKIGAARYD